MGDISGVSLRPLRDTDLEAAVELLMTTSVLDIRHRLRERLTAPGTDGVSCAFVAERDGVLTGAAKLTAEPAFPGTVSALVAVEEAARGQGIGTALARLLGEHFRRAGRPYVVTCAIRDDLVRGREFAERYGFAVTHHSVGLRLRLSGPAGPVMRSAVRAAGRAGVRTWAADPDAARRTIVDCVRRSMAGLPVPFAEDQEFDPELDGQLIPRGSLVVMAEPLGEEGRPCAVTILSPESGGESWHIGYTGVDPGYRGRGVAEAVKRASLLAAHRAGVRSVTTVNDDGNRPIRRLNQRLGMEHTTGYWSLACPARD